MEHSLYPVPPRFTVRRLVLMDLAAICTLYGACGRDAAWGTCETLAALFGEGEWWGGFLGGELVVCCACVPARSATPQAALRPHYLLTPPGLRQPAPGTPNEDAVRRVHIPLADTLAVSRLLEQGFCGIALYDGADGQPALRLERPNPA